LLSGVAFAFAGQAWQLAALRIVLTALAPQAMHVLCTLLAEGALAAYVPGRQSQDVWSALGADSSAAHITHSAFSPPRDASELPQGMHPDAAGAAVRPNKLPMKLARSTFAMPCPGEHMAALLLATRPNSSTASS
jgi:hypothetical protein